MKMHPYEPVTDEFFRNAPVRHATPVEIDAAPERVFAALEDPESWPQWVGAITRVDWTSPKPFKVGTTRTVYIQGNQVVDEYFFNWEDNRRMSFYFVSASFAALTQFAEDYRLEELPGGRTRLTWTFAANPKPLHKIIFTLLSPVFAIFLKKVMKDFKKYVEAQH